MMDLVERDVADNRAPRRRLPGSTDVARLAGVSQKTVSRVFNDEPYVTAPVRERVLRAAQELGYRPNGAARALTTGRTRCIGVVSLGSALYGPATQLVGVERAARRIGYAVRVVNTMEGDVQGITGALDSLLEQGVDGIVISEPIDEGTGPLEIAVPVVVMGQLPGLVAPLVITVGGASDVPATAATQHLLSLGHETVHHVAGPQAWFSARERREGWQRALRSAGRNGTCLEGDWSVASGYAAGQRLARDLDVTAVFAANDDMAIGVIHALVEAGRPVPGEVSVVGFDDIPVAAYVNPPLTTVRQPFDETTDAALQALVHGIENPDGTADSRLDPTMELVVRRSSAPPRARRRPEQRA